jgi:L,D-transpeptidase catalytic domain
VHQPSSATIALSELQSGLGVPGGPRNPLGSRDMYLWQGNKDTLYRIHGTVEPWTIGRSVSSGCIRMINQDVIDLYQRTPVGGMARMGLCGPRRRRLPIRVETFRLGISKRPGGSRRLCSDNWRGLVVLPPRPRAREAAIGFLRLAALHSNPGHRTRLADDFLTALAA